MNGLEFKKAREALGLTYVELGAILGGVRPDTIRRKWECDNPPPSPIAVQAVKWMQQGYRPPEYPERLSDSADMVFGACTIALVYVERKTGISRWDIGAQRAFDIILAKSAKGLKDG